MILGSEQRVNFLGSSSVDQRMRVERDFQGRRERRKLKSD
jgi:hypothetical protein